MGHDYMFLSHALTSYFVDSDGQEPYKSNCKHQMVPIKSYQYISIHFFIIQIIMLIAAGLCVDVYMCSL